MNSLEFLDATKVATKRGLIWLNYLSGNYQKKLFLLGDGRSGTTWLGNTLNFDHRYRELFEPFDAGNFSGGLCCNSEYAGIGNQSSLEAQIRLVDRGAYISRHVTRKFPGAFHRGLFIKDVHSHLVVDELLAAFPDMPTVFILRHPLSVALSKTKAFNWPTDPLTFLSEYNPRKEEVEQFEPLVRSITERQEPILNHVLIWCLLLHYVCRSQFLQETVLTFYEPLVMDPEPILPAIFAGIGQDDVYQKSASLIHDRALINSHVTMQDNTVSESRTGVPRWRIELSASLIRDALTIVEEFGFLDLYGEEHLPGLSAAEMKAAALQR